MRATDPAQVIRSLCLDPSDFERFQQEQQQQQAPLPATPAAEDPHDPTTTLTSSAYTGGTKLIKVCGITNPEDALVACQAGANLIGIIFVPKSKRCVTSVEQAQAVVRAVQAFGERTGPVEIFGNVQQHQPPPQQEQSKETTTTTNKRKNPLLHLIASSQALETASRRCPLVVGVFQNQESEYIKRMVKECGLDLVQLHGQEGMAAANVELCGAPAIRVVDMETDPTFSNEGTTSNPPNNTTSIAESLLATLTTCDPIAILLDTSIKNPANGGSSGGTGITFDWNVAQQVQASGLPVMIAGGLEPNNVKDAVGRIRPWGVDVSSGVEIEPGKKDHAKVEEFVKSARAAASSG